MKWGHNDTVAEFARIQRYPRQRLNSCEFSYKKWD